jgi:hypothetical protein
MKYFGALLFCFVGFNTFLFSQNLPISAKLEEIYSRLPIECKNNINSATDTCTCKINGKLIPVKAIFDSEGKLSHIGLNLFSFDKNLVFSPNSLAFIERTLLFDLLVDNIGIINKKNTEDRITISFNEKSLGQKGFSSIADIFPIISSKFDFRIDKDSLSYVAQLHKNNYSLKIKYPANNNVVSGMDKKEYGDFIASSLKKYTLVATLKEINQPNELQNYKDNIKVTLGTSYYKSITTCKYYDSSLNDSYVPLFSKDYPLESFSNSFLINTERNKEIQLHIEHRIYGTDIEKYVVNLSNFLNYFGKDFEYYFGIEENTDRIMTGSLIMFNRGLNFINLLWVKSDKTMLFGSNAIIEAKFYTNIPTDNIKNLFADYKSDKIK